MKTSLPMRALFIFVIILSLATLVIKLASGAPFSAILKWLLPTAAVLSAVVIWIRKTEKKRRDYHSHFSDNGS